MKLYYVADLCKAFELSKQLLGLAGQCWSVMLAWFMPLEKNHLAKPSMEFKVVNWLQLHCWLSPWKTYLLCKLQLEISSRLSCQGKAEFIHFLGVMISSLVTRLIQMIWSPIPCWGHLKTYQWCKLQQDTATFLLWLVNLVACKLCLHFFILRWHSISWSYKHTCFYVLIDTQTGISSWFSQEVVFKICFWIGLKKINLQIFRIFFFY